MIINLRLLTIVLFLLIFVNSCRNKLMTEVERSACTPAIANPRLDWYSINDCTLSSGAQSSVFYILLNKYGDCIDDSSVFTITINSYDPSGAISSPQIVIPETAYILRDQLRLGVCLLFGSATTKYAKVDIQCTGNNGKTSNTVSLVLNRPKGAN